MMMCWIWSSRFLEFLRRFQYGLYENNFYYIIIVLLDSFYKEVVFSQWRRSRAFIKATKHCHRARTCSDIAQLDTPTPLVSLISSRKRAQVDMLARSNNRGMTYQTEEKNLTYLLEYFVGVIKLEMYC